MRHSLITFFAIFGLLGITTSQAQIDAGVRTGVFISNIDHRGNTEVIDQVSSSMISEQLGVFGEYTLSPSWTIKTGATYVKKGTVLSYDESIGVGGFDIPVGIRAKYQSEHIDIPLTAQYYFGYNDTKYFVSAGGGYSLATGASIRPQATALFGFNLPEISIPTDDINTSIYYGTIGVGISHPVGPGKIIGEVGYQNSFESVIPNTIIDLDMKNKGYSVGIGYAMSF